MLLSNNMQQTIANNITCRDIGLHSGHMVNMVIRPAAVDTGIVFVRTDVEGGASLKSQVPALYHLVTDTMLGTRIENAEGVQVSTIEHLMAAFWGLGIDNAIIELDAAEVPIMDGSSEPFIALIENAGITTQSKLRNVIKITEEITVSDGDSVATIVPHDGFMLDISIDYAHKAVGADHAVYDFDFVTFDSALSEARTFGFAEEIEYLQKNGRARGGSLDNAIVVGADGVVNKDGLRFDDEFIRHKALDCVGDYFLAGMRIEGKVITSKPGHGINNKLLKGIFANKHAWQVKVSDGEYAASNPCLYKSAESFQGAVVTASL